MENELIIKTEDKELRITSVELVKIINRFREEESKIANKKVAELKHKDFMKKIRNELKVLETLGLDNERNIIKSSYTDKKNQERPCYSINKDGIKIILDITKNRDRIPLQKQYEKMGGNCSWTICVDRFETSFLNKLSTVLNVIGIEYEFQKPVLNNKYKIDCYLNKYNLAIEYDEQQHYVEPQKSKDIKRQKKLKQN